MQVFVDVSKNEGRIIDFRKLQWATYRTDVLGNSFQKYHTNQKVYECPSI